MRANHPGTVFVLVGVALAAAGAIVHQAGRPLAGLLAIIAGWVLLTIACARTPPGGWTA